MRRCPRLRRRHRRCGGRHTGGWALKGIVLPYFKGGARVRRCDLLHPKLTQVGVDAPLFFVVPFLGIIIAMSRRTNALVRTFVTNLTSGMSFQPDKLSQNASYQTKQCFIRLDLHHNISLQLYSDMLHVLTKQGLSKSETTLNQKLLREGTLSSAVAMAC